jgi:hypothetical protein
MKTTHERFKDWCKETNRSGGVLVGSSIKEFCEWLDKKEVPEKEVEFCGKYKWGDCECETECRRGLRMW